MIKKLFLLMAAFFVAIAVHGQQNKTAVDDIETSALGRLHYRANVVPYSDEDDIEQSAYRRSSNYLSLAGIWRCKVSGDYEYAGQEIEDKHFSVDAWDEMELPCRSLQMASNRLSLLTKAQPANIPHQGNVSALFCRTFHVDESWKEDVAVFRMQARSAFHLWVNRKYVGYAEDSRAVHEFDITRYLRAGRSNEVVVQLVSLATGSLLESRYDPSMLGITLEPAIVFTPSTRVDDYTLHASYDAMSHSGHLTLDATVASNRGKGRYYLEVEVWNPQGREVAKLGKWLFFDKRNAVELQLEYVLSDVLPWSAENPARYTAVLRLLDEKMKPLMSTGCRFGFRTVELQGGRMLLNGVPLTLRGVAFVDDGRSEDSLRMELLRMKQHNVNAIRTIHYSPARSAFYDLCDELGFYVMCDANIQPYSGQHKAVASDADYADLFLERARSMYEQLKNHPSVVIWSLGRSVDNGVCMMQTYRLLKRLDSSRPVFFAAAGSGEGSDFASMINPNVGEVRKMLSRGLSRPLLVAEYGESEGNMLGGLQQLWSSLTATAGGFAASWNSYVESADDGRAVHHTGLSQRPVLGELAAAYRPFDITLQTVSPDAVEFLVKNRSHVLPLGSYRVTYVLYTHLKPRIIEGEINAALPAGESYLLKLRIPKLTLYSDEELMIRFEVRPRDIPYLDRQMALSTTTFVLPSAHIAKQALPAYDRWPLQVTFDDSSRQLVVTGQRLAVRFDCRNGSLEQLTLDGDSLLQYPLALTFWHSTVCGDAALNSRAAMWMPFRDMQPRLVDVDYRSLDAYTVMVNMMLRYVSATGAPLFDVRQQYTLFHTGDILVDNELRTVHPMVTPSRVGLACGWALPVDSVSWTGLSAESYSDRHSDSRMGSFVVAPRWLQSPHAFTRRMTLMGSRAALYMDMADTLFSFDMQRQCQGWNVNVEYYRAPVGGVETPMPATVSQQYHFVVHLRPFRLGEEDADDFARTAYPLDDNVLLPMPVIQSNSERFNAPMQITLSLPASDRGQSVGGAEIHYTLDGTTPDIRSPRYTAPFTVDASTTVNARAFKTGQMPSFVSSRTFNYDYVQSIDFASRPNTPYNRHYQTALSDGITGSVDDLSHAWLGFSGNDMEITVTLGKMVDLADVVLRFAHQPSAWTFAPTAVTVSTSSDGEHYSEPVEAALDFDALSENNNNPRLVEPVVHVNQRGVRYVRIKARNVGRVPAWHQAKGLHAWLMADEMTLIEMKP